MTKLIPFDLERAIAGDPLITRCGYPVDEFHYFKFATKNTFQIVAVIGGYMYFFNVNGRNCIKNFDNEYDLFMKPQIKTYWMNVYYSPSRKMYSGSYLFPTKESALEQDKDTTYIKTISFEIEE